MQQCSTKFTDDKIAVTLICCPGRNGVLETVNYIWVRRHTRSAINFLHKNVNLCIETEVEYEFGFKFYII